MTLRQDTGCSMGDALDALECAGWDLEGARVLVLGPRPSGLRMQAALAGLERRIRELEQSLGIEREEER